MAATTGQLGLVTPTQGTLSGTWGDTVTNGITEYVNIAIAGTLSFAGDGAITLANTTGSASATNFSSTTAQYMVIRITGTQTVTKVITGPSYSKLYMVDHAGATSAVTFKASGQTGVSVAVGEKCFVYFNGTDYVKVASSVADGVTSVGGTGTVNGITLTGTVTSTGNLTLGGTLSGVNLTSQVTGTLPIANGGTGTTSTTFANLTTNVTGTLPIANGGTGVTTSTGTGSTVLSASPTFTGTPLAPTATVNTNTTQLATTAFVQTQIAAITTGVASFSGGTTGLTPATATTGAVTLAGTLAVANGGTGTTTPSLVAGSNITVTGTWPNQTIAAAGGGSTAGQYSAVASGILANGSTVVINSDGTVSAVAGASSAAGTATAFTGSGVGVSGGNGAISVAFDSTNNRVVVAYVNSVSSRGTAAVGTVSGTSISFGTPVDFDSSGISYPSIVFDPNTGKVVIAYNGSTGKAIVGTVSGTSISFGTAVTLSSSTIAYVQAMYDTTNSKVVVAYQDAVTNYGTAIVGTVSGTSISFGTAVTFLAGNAFYVSAAYTGTKVVVAYRDGNNSNYGTAIVGTVSGTSISFGTSAVFNTGVANYTATAYDTLNAKVVIAYQDNSNSDYGTAVVGTVSGTSVSFGTKAVFSSQTTNNIAIAYNPYAKQSVIACWSSGATTGSTVTAAVSGTSVSFPTAYTYNAVSTFYPAIVYSSTVQKMVVAYVQQSSPFPGYAQVLTTGFATNLSATNYIGISSAAYANGATALIQTVGSVDDAQTSLTPGLAYYVQTTGALASTAGSPSVFAGTAVSATQILVKG